MDSSQSLETNNPEKKSKKKIFITLGIIILTVCSYLGYDYYQSQQYIEKIFPIYNSFDVVDQDVLSMNEKSAGKRFGDIFDEVKALKKASKDLKLKFSEVVPQNIKSHEIKDKFNELLDLQCDIIDNYNLLFQSGMSYQNMEEYIKEFEGSPYSENSIEKARKQMKEADEGLNKAYKKHKLLIGRYKDKKLEFTQLIGK